MARATVSRGRRTARSGGKAPPGSSKRAKPDPSRAKAKKAGKRVSPKVPTAAPIDDRPRLRAAPPPIDHDIDPEVLEFISAIESYRLAHARPFPSWSEVLHVVRQLGYRKA
jgi:hypothetical protein